MTKPAIKLLHIDKITLLPEELQTRHNKDVHLHIASMMFRVLKDYALYGNVAHVSMMSGSPVKPPGWSRWDSSKPTGAWATGSIGRSASAGTIGWS